MVEAAAPWHSVTSWTRQEVAQLQVLVTLHTAPQLTRGYTTAGQYLHIRTPEGEGFFALCSRPGEPLQLLVKDGASASHWLTRVAENTPFEMAEVAGAGFFSDDVTHAQHALLCGTGSGIAPLRPLFHDLLDAGHKPTLLYGGTHSETLAFADELMKAGQSRGARVILFVSQGPPQPHHRRGRLVTAIDRDVVDPRRTIAFLCGVKPMIIEATSALETIGVPAKNIRLNY